MKILFLQTITLSLPVLLTIEPKMVSIYVPGASSPIRSTSLADLMSVINYKPCHLLIKYTSSN